MADASVAVVNGQLSYIMRDIKRVPVHLASTFGDQIKRIDLSDNCLCSLSGLGEFLKLEEVVLDCNGLTEDVLDSLPSLPKVHTLSLNKNKLKDLDRVLSTVHKCLPTLKYLSLLGNEACPDQLSNHENDEDDYYRYRLFVLFKLPQLRFLDSSPFRESDKASALQKGPYLRVVRLSNDELSTMGRDSSPTDANDYRPLPQTSGNSSPARAMFGKCRYVYYGRHSEGNRFIRNNDL